MADEKKSELVVPLAEGHEHGYWGNVPDDTPNEAYTLAGVTGQLDAEGDAEKPAPKRRSSSSKS
jgi:hypothetical protein